MKPVKPVTAATKEFMADVRAGLSATPKRLSCRWFYDAEGSRLFEAIMRLPEYYLTGCEAAILKARRDEILRAFLRGGHGRPGERFQVVDLGAGNGEKTRILLEHFLKQESLASYVPVDVSGEALEGLDRALRRSLPGLTVDPVENDWLSALEDMEPSLSARKLVLFLGSSIGNLNRPEAGEFLSALRARLRPGDGLLIGFDLRKNPQRILRAYSDSAGVTARFNLNLLDRINRELGGDFRLEDFHHRATYDHAFGVARSYLVAQRDLEVRIAAAGLTVRFRRDEAIHTEDSWKYSYSEVGAMARNAGFAVAAHYQDATDSFVDSLWFPAAL